jgi:putative Ca2+/H+ antiporter (TMEM165/GDT1 family)
MKSSPFWLAFFTAIVAELPCVARAGALCGRVGEPGPLFWGTLLGTALLLAPTLFLADQLHHRLPAGILQVGSGLFFILMGVYFLTGKH